MTAPWHDRTLESRILDSIRDEGPTNVAGLVGRLKWPEIEVASSVRMLVFDGHLHWKTTGSGSWIVEMKHVV